MQYGSRLWRSLEDMTYGHAIKYLEAFDRQDGGNRANNYRKRFIQSKPKAKPSQG